MDPWKELYTRFDPERPEADASRRAERPRSPAQAVAARLDLDDVDGRFLLIGTVGTGKTTELLRIANARGAKEMVIYLDLVRHFQQVVGDPAALHKIAPWEIVFLASIALLRAAQERLDFEFDANSVHELEAAWKRLADASATPSTPPMLDLGQLGKAMVVLASTAVGGAAGSAIAATVSALPSVEGAKWELPIGLNKKSLADQSGEVQHLLGAFNQLVGQVQMRHHAVLFIIDGLDRVSDIDHAQDLFCRSNLLGALECKLVVCAPFVLRHHPTLSTVRRFDIMVLVNEPVLDKTSPDEPGPGVEFLCAVFLARARDIPDLIFPDGELRRIAYYSGGRVRDFIKLIRDVALQVRLARAAEVSTELVDEALRERRLTLERGLTRGHIGVLRQVMEDTQHLLPADDLTWELLSTDRLLPYPDGSEWYYPHPLLLLGGLLL